MCRERERERGVGRERERVRCRERCRESIISRMNNEELIIIHDAFEI